MNNRISLSEFTQLVELAETQYPNAKVVSVYSGCRDGKWFYALFLECDGKKITYEIPSFLD